METLIRLAMGSSLTSLVASNLMLFPVVKMSSSKEWTSPANRLALGSFPVKQLYCCERTEAQHSMRISAKALPDIAITLIVLSSRIKDMFSW